MSMTLPSFCTLFSSTSPFLMVCWYSVFLVSGWIVSTIPATFVDLAVQVPRDHKPGELSIQERAGNPERLCHGAQRHGLVGLEELPLHHLANLPEKVA